MDYSRRPNTLATANRLTAVAVVLLLWAIRIFYVLYSLQVTHHAKYQQDALKQQQKKVTVPAVRGSIFDRNGHLLAISMPLSMVSVNPMLIKELSVAADLLSSPLHVDRNHLYSRLQWAHDNDRGYVVVKHGATPAETASLKALSLNYVRVDPESLRRYPDDEIGAHVVGTVFQGEQGAAGVEKVLDTVLRGHAGAETRIVDVRGNGVESTVNSAVQAGDPVTLTIDGRLQYIVERELKKGVEEKHARYGTAIVMNPYTGEVLALANYPTYDPNSKPVPGESRWARINLGVSVPFEPGSIFKVITLSAALETTNMKPETPVATGNGTLSLPGRVVHEAHGGYGTITMQQVLEKSSNIGAILIGTRVGREKMYEYVKKFGFGDATGIGLPAESRGLFRPLNRWGTTSLASVSMGQEVSTTSVQLARACSVIANGGMLVKPSIVLKRGSKPEPVATPVRILKPETVMTMRMMMEGVVLRGTARNTARLDGYTSAGKTGTAQIFENGHYTHLYNASFMGFAPVTNPKLVIVVTLNGTAGNAGMGGAAAAPIFREIATEAFRLLDVPRDIPEDETKKPVKDLKPVLESASIADLGNDSIMAEDQSVKLLLAEQEKLLAKAAAQAAALDEEMIPATKTAAPLLALAQPGPPAPTAPTPPAAKLASASGSSAPGLTAPDFRGRSMRSVVEEASAEGIPLTIEGSGVARIQMPPPGQPLRPGERIRIVFTR